MKSKNKKEYFYCNSYQAFFMALKIYKESNNITILTSKEDIIKTCKYLKIPYISFNTYSLREIVFNLKAIKNEIKDICIGIKGNVLHFSHTQFDVFCFLFVKTYTNFGSVKFYNFEFVYDTVNRIMFNKEFVKLFMLKFIINYFFRTNIIIKTVSGKLLLGINDDFLKRNNIEIIDKNLGYYKCIFEVSKKMQLKLKTSKNLFLTQPLTMSNLFKEKSLDLLYNFLASQDISVKYHPNSNEKDIFSSKEKVPNFLPAELIFNNVSNSIIAMYSAALITASKFKNIKTISLLSLAEARNESFALEMKKYLIKESNNRIIFPETFEELEKYLN